MRRAIVPAATAVLLLVLTACGSTAQQAGVLPAPGALPDGLAASAPAIGDGLGSPGVPGVPTTPDGPASPGGGGTGGGAAPGSGGGQPAPGATTAGPSRSRAATASLAPVRLGFTTVPDAAAFFASFGAQSSDVDQAALFRSAVRYVNRIGGLNGHPIEAVIGEVSATSQESYDSQYQQLCSFYTQDQKVVAAGLVGIGGNTNMDACMNDARTLLVTGSNTLHDEADYRRTPLVVSPMEVTASVLAKTLAELIVNRRLEVRGGKVGILQYDLPTYNRAFDQQFKPILERAGIGVVRYTIPPPSSTSEIGASVSVVQSAQLRMASDGIKTVTFLCSGCAGFFIQSAGGQNYYPRYVLSTLDSPGAADGATYEQSLRTSLSVAWAPNADYGTTTPPAPIPYNDTYRECLKVQKEQLNGDAAAVPIAIITCDAVLGFYHAAKANPVEPITSTSLRDGFLTLGSNNPSALTFATNLRPGKHAGASHYRLMTWNDRCSCPAYSGPLVPFPVL